MDDLVITHIGPENFNITYAKPDAQQKSKYSLQTLARSSDDATRTHHLHIDMDQNFVCYVVSGRSGDVLFVTRLDDVMTDTVYKAAKIHDVKFGNFRDKVVLAVTDGDELAVFRIESGDGMIRSRQCFSVKSEEPYEHNKSEDRIAWRPYRYRYTDFCYLDSEVFLAWVHQGHFFFFGEEIVNSSVALDKWENNNAGHIGEGNITCLFISPSARLFCCFDTGSMLVFGIKMVSFWLLYQGPSPHQGKVINSCFFLEGMQSFTSNDYAVTGAADNTELKIWCLRDFACLQTLNFAMDNQDSEGGRLEFKMDYYPYTGVVILLNTSNSYSFVLYLDHLHHLPYLAPYPYVKSIAKILLPSSGCTAIAIKEASVDLEWEESTSMALLITNLNLLVLQGNDIGTIHALYVRPLPMDMMLELQNQSQLYNEPDIAMISEFEAQRQQTHFIYDDRQMVEISSPGSEKIEDSANGCIRDDDLTFLDSQFEDDHRTAKADDNGFGLNQIMVRNRDGDIHLVVFPAECDEQEANGNQNWNQFAIADLDQETVTEETPKVDPHNSRPRIETDTIDSHNDDEADHGMHSEENLRRKNHDRTMVYESQRKTKSLESVEAGDERLSNERAEDSMSLVGAVGGNVSLNYSMEGIVNDNDSDEGKDVDNEGYVIVQSIEKWLQNLAKEDRPSLTCTANKAVEDSLLDRTKNQKRDYPNLSLESLDTKLNVIIDMLEKQDQEIQNIKSKLVMDKVVADSSANLMVTFTNQMGNVLEKTISTEIAKQMDDFLVKQTVMMADFENTLVTSLNCGFQKLMIEADKRQSINYDLSLMVPDLKEGLERFQKNFLDDIEQSMNQFKDQIDENLNGSLEGFDLRQCLKAVLFNECHTAFQTICLETLTKFFSTEYDKLFEDLFMHFRQNLAENFHHYIVEAEMQFNKINEIMMDHQLDSDNRKLNDLKAQMSSLFNEQKYHLNENLERNRKDLSELLLHFNKSLKKDFKLLLQNQKASNLNIPASQMPSSSLPSDARRIAEDYLNLGLIDKAFQHALLPKNRSIVEYILDQIDFYSIFLPDCHLAQSTLLALIHYLSQNLPRLSDKTKYLMSESLLALNLDDSLTRKYAPKVLLQLFQNYSEFLKDDPENSKTTSIRTNLRVVECLLKQLKQPLPK